MTGDSRIRQGHPPDDRQKETVQQTLDVLLHSPVFSSAHRSRRFLSYVVEQQLLGNGQSFKERTIGVEVFDRPLNYSTGDDPIVRVQAGDVRRRLERFYQLPESKALPVLITLPLGSYCPEFRFREVEASSIATSAPLTSTETLSEEPQTAEVSSGRLSTGPKVRKRSLRTAVLLGTLCLSVILITLTGLFIRGSRLVPGSPADGFWQPIFATKQPILICLAKTVTYHPSQRLFNEYAAKHPGTFEEEWQRMAQPLPLDTSHSIQWGDMPQLVQYGVASGDTYAAAELSVLFARKEKVSQLRIGSDYSFEDLRKSPAVVVGAFNNRWTMQLAASMPYIFDDKDDRLGIREKGGDHRIWYPSIDKHGQLEDYALVARLLNTDTGQFVVIVGGIGTHGTQAATEFITNNAYLNAGLRALDPSWPNRNLVFVLKTTVTDSVVGPPTIVTSQVW